MYEGDPKLFLSEDGVDLDFKNGQPQMDKGLENYVLISLFTNPDWVGNLLFDGENEKIGSTFQEQAKKPITISNLSVLEETAKASLSGDIFGGAEVIATNPNSFRIDVDIGLKPPIKLTKNTLNWISQYDPND